MPQNKHAGCECKHGSAMAHYGGGGGGGLLPLLCCCLLYDSLSSRWQRAPPRDVVYVQAPPRVAVLQGTVQPVVYGAPVKNALPLIACVAMDRGPLPLESV